MDVVKFTMNKIWQEVQKSMKKGLLAAILAALIILLGAWALAD